MDEPYYYHALAVAARGSYPLIKKYHRKGNGSWEAAYARFKKENLFPLPPRDDPRAAYERMGSLGIRLALAGDEEFPKPLRQIPDAPFGIYLRGAILPPAVRHGRTDGEAGDAPPRGEPPALAVVGTRRASAEGKKTARAFARELAAAGCTIISGLAFGIDAAAHEGALDARAATVAVLAGGLDAVYPHTHHGLAERILASGGTLVSEYPPGEAPLAYRFIERNRIMSGIARGVLVVEAPEASGALATARYAAEQDRELFVVPGAVHDFHFAGSHALIRQGAELVTTPEDILVAYEVHRRAGTMVSTAGASPEEILILRVLAETSTPADVDKLVRMTTLEPRIVNQAISFLLIRGVIKEMDTGYILETNYW